MSLRSKLPWIILGLVLIWWFHALILGVALHSVEVLQFAGPGPFRRLRLQTRKQSSAQTKVSCVVEGNCIGTTTCVNHICVPYIRDSGRHKKDKAACVAACLSDARLDERFYHGAGLRMVHELMWEEGCAVVYQRLSLNQETDLSEEEWLSQRRGAVRRQDPYGNDLQAVFCPWQPKACTIEADCVGLTRCVNHTCSSYMVNTGEGHGCVEACWKEIALYESHYYDRKVSQLDGYGSVNGGCTVVYEILRVGETGGVSKEDYEKQTRGNMVRTELVGEHKKRWGAWCNPTAFTSHNTTITLVSSPPTPITPPPNQDTLTIIVPTVLRPKAYVCTTLRELRTLGYPVIAVSRFGAPACEEIQVGRVQFVHLETETDPHGAQPGKSWLWGTPARRRQSMDYVAAFRYAATLQSTYIMIVEDDSSACPGLQRMLTSIIRGSGSGIGSVAFAVLGWGASGMVLHHSALRPLTTYVMKHLTERNIDDLMLQFFETSKRCSVLGTSYGFYHTGMEGTFGDRWQRGDKSQHCSETRTPQHLYLSFVKGLEWHTLNCPNQPQFRVFLDGYNDGSALARTLFPDALHIAPYSGQTTSKSDILLFGMNGPRNVGRFAGKQLWWWREPGLPTTIPNNVRYIGPWRPHSDDESHIQVYFAAIAASYAGIQRLTAPRNHTSGQHLLSYVYSNCESHREEAFDRLVTFMEEEVPNAVIHAGGKCYGSHPELHHPWKTQHWLQNQRTQPYRFQLVMEKRDEPSYISEKIVGAFLAGAIPIYWGTKTVFRLFNPDAFVYYDVQNPMPALTQLRRLIRNETLYLEMMNRPILAKGAATEYFLEGDLRRKIRSMLGLGEPVVGSEVEGALVTAPSTNPPSHVLWSRGWEQKVECQTVPHSYYAARTETRHTPAQMKPYFRNCGGLIWIRLSTPKSDVQTFIESVLPHMTKRFTLVTTDGDAKVPSEIKGHRTLLDHPLLDAWFTQNYDGTVLHPKLHLFPIGFDLHTPKHDWNGLETMKAMKRETQRKNSMFVNFGWMNGDRTAASKALDCGVPHTHVQRVPVKTLYKHYSDYRFGLSPHGNGLDCHRTWEMLWFGMIPIVKRSSLDSLYNGLPVIIVDDWKDLCRRNLTELHESVQHLLPVPDEVFTLEWWMQRKAHPPVPTSSAAFPTTTIPKRIHQTWKSHSLPLWSKASSWKERNPDWQYRLWDDDEAAELVRSHFPRVWGVWDRLRPVERADVFRYAVVYVHGGVYADLDVACIRPIDTWPGISMNGIVGIEGVMRDEAEMRRVKFVAMTQYCQWTFAFAPKHPTLRRALDLVVQRVNAGVQDTLTKTGPGVFTAALASIEPDVRVLPGNAFACCGGYGNSLTPTKDTLVKHGFVGSWKGWKPPPAHPTAAAYVPGADGTYAQNYQDVWFEAVMLHNGWDRRPGFYLDLGAFKPLECSNTALLDIKYRWDGVCVEPRKEIDFGSRRCVLVNRPMTGTSGTEVWMGSPVKGKETEHNPDSQLFNILTKSRFPNGGGTVMRTIDATDLLACVANTTCGTLTVPYFIEFVNLDVEDNEADVLRTWPWTRHKVAVFVIENRAPGGSTAKQEAVRRTMQRQGYLLAPVQNPGVDEYWILPEFWDESLAAKEWRVHPPGSNGC